MSNDPLVPALRPARRLQPLALVTAGAFVGATVAMALWARPEQVVVPAAPAPSCPELSCPDLTCPEAPACPSLTCAALPEPPPAPVHVPAIQVSPAPGARAWSKQLSKHIDEFMAPGEEGYSSIALAGDFVVAVEPYMPEEPCAATPESSVARAYDRETGKPLWTIPVDDWTSLVSTSAGLLVVVNDKGPDTNSLRLLDHNKKTLWSTDLDQCGALRQQGDWLVDSSDDTRCARNLASGAVYEVPSNIREDRQARDAYWKQVGLPSARVEITCPEVDHERVYSSACDEQGTAQVRYKCSGKKCRATVDYTPWTAPVER